MSFWERINSFFLSELWWKIYFIMFIVYVSLEIIRIIIDKYLERKAVKEFEEKVHKYGIPKDFEAPDSVWYHIGALIELCEKYELESLYEAQDKFDELYSVHWRSMKLSDEDMKTLQHPATTYVPGFDDLLAYIPEFQRMQLNRHKRFVSCPQRPDDYIEDKPDETYISPFNELGACLPRVESKQFKYYGIFKLTEQRPVH